LAARVELPHNLKERCGLAALARSMEYKIFLFINESFDRVKVDPLPYRDRVVLFRLDGSCGVEMFQNRGLLTHYLDAPCDGGAIAPAVYQLLAV